MNEKAFISKDLNSRHIKILEGLVKLPENRECADCRTKAPRWASVNLGVFICMQCSGIHRNLGVHISKVRSTTLDTWLPEQVAFMQGMGNVRSNEYWEACLSPDYDRSDVHKFIRAKYEEKRWAAKNAAPPLPRQPDDRGGIPLSYYDDTARGANPNGLPPKKTRNLSLEEEILTHHVATIDPPARHRAMSLDMKDDAATPATTTRAHEAKNASLDLFGLLYSRDANLPPPSSRHNPTSWATFECKIHYKISISFACSDSTERNEKNQAEQTQISNGVELMQCERLQDQIKGGNNTELLARQHLSRHRWRDLRERFQRLLHGSAGVTIATNFCLTDANSKKT